jgi:hypothetical protein
MFHFIGQEFGVLMFASGSVAPSRARLQWSLSTPRGCQGPPPSVPGASASWRAIEALFGRDEVCVECWFLLDSRLRGIAALQVSVIERYLKTASHIPSASH